MSAPAFTPGPWHVFSARSIRSSNPQHKGSEVAHTTYGWGDGRRMANARLIAAAPELYEALAECAHWVEWCIHYHDAPDSSLEQAALAQATAALAKARGEQ